VVVVGQADEIGPVRRHRIDLHPEGMVASSGRLERDPGAIGRHRRVRIPAGSVRQPARVRAVHPHDPDLGIAGAARGNDRAAVCRPAEDAVVSIE
jgi:hypothetical protein